VSNGWLNARIGNDSLGRRLVEAGLKRVFYVGARKARAHRMSTGNFSPPPFARGASPRKLAALEIF
jgi:hypothetical protein